MFMLELLMAIWIPQQMLKKTAMIKLPMILNLAT